MQLECCHEEENHGPAALRVPLNATLEVLGDRWSLLIVRDLIFKGRTTYKDFLAGGEGIATNVLADRLRRLEAEGVIEKGATQLMPGAWFTDLRQRTRSRARAGSR